MIQYIYQAQIVLVKIDNGIYQVAKDKIGGYKSKYFTDSNVVHMLNEIEKVAIVEGRLDGKLVHANFAIEDKDSVLLSPEHFRRDEW